jgi:hypothetical protein
MNRNWNSLYVLLLHQERGLISYDADRILKYFHARRIRTGKPALFLGPCIANDEF